MTAGNNRKFLQTNLRIEYKKEKIRIYAGKNNIVNLKNACLNFLFFNSRCTNKRYLTLINEIGHDTFARVVQTMNHVQRDVIWCSRHCRRRVFVVTIVLEWKAFGRLKLEPNIRLCSLALALVVVSDFPHAVWPAAPETRGRSQQQPAVTYYYYFRRRRNDCHANVTLQYYDVMIILCYIITIVNISLSVIAVSA